MPRTRATTTTATTARMMTTRQHILVRAACWYSAAFRNSTTPRPVLETVESMWLSMLSADTQLQGVRCKASTRMSRRAGGGMATRPREQRGGGLLRTDHARLLVDERGEVDENVVHLLDRGLDLLDALLPLLDERALEVPVGIELHQLLPLLRLHEAVLLIFRLVHERTALPGPNNTRSVVSADTHNSTTRTAHTHGTRSIATAAHHWNVSE